MEQKKTYSSKSIKTLAKEKEYKEDQEIMYNIRIEATLKWRDLYQEQIQLAKAEIKLKSANPLPLNPEYQYETTEEWSGHLAKAYKIALTGEILKTEATIFDLENQIKMFEEKRDEEDE